MISLWPYKIRYFTPRYKQDLLEFFSSLSKESRILLSTCGIDPKTLYYLFRIDYQLCIPLLVYEKKKVIAIAKLHLGKKEGYLSSVAVLDSHQGKGIGTRMIKYLFALALMNGIDKIFTEVKEENTKALSFFKKLGFKEKGRKSGLVSLEREL